VTLASNASSPAAISGRVSIQGGVKLDFSKYDIFLQPSKGGMSLNAKLRPDGTYSFKDVVPGSYTVSLLTQNSPQRRYLLDAPPAITVEPGAAAKADLELREGIPVRGRFQIQGGS
jgi:hypothetical protein